MPGVEVKEAVSVSKLDSERFGVRAARAHVSLELLPCILDFCAVQKIEFLIARCATRDISAAQAMERHGFQLMDTLVYFTFDLVKKVIPPCSKEFVVRRSQPEDSGSLRALALTSFEGYTGHYHADPRLDRTKCNETYASWAERSVTVEGVADEVLVAEYQKNLIGFGTLRLNSSKAAEGLLYAVAPSYQKQGVGPALMVHSLQWCRAEGAERMLISTQITNVSMQKVWCRVGFEPSHSYYTFHKWFDE